MIRAGLYGLLASVVCVSITQAQLNSTSPYIRPSAPYAAVPPNLGSQEMTYVWSEQVTCTCGQTVENFAGGPRTCGHCGTALPAAPTHDANSVSQVAYMQGGSCPGGNCNGGGAAVGGYPAQAYPSAGVYEQYADMGSCGSSDCGSFAGCEPCGYSGGSRYKLKDLFQNFSLCTGPSPCSTLLATPGMIGGGFVGSGQSPLQGNRILAGNLTATGTLVGANLGVNSALQFDTPTTVANPDFQSVGIGTITGGLITFNVVESIPGTVPGCPPGSTLVSATATEQVGGGIASGELFDIAINCQTAFNVLIPNAANAGAAVVGRSRIADNNSPLPRTRVFFDYSFIDNVAVSQNGVSVNRFTPGMEWAANDKTSVEIRVPFATTLSSDIMLDSATDTGRTEFGDFFLAFKQLLMQGEDFAISGGVGVTLPSANDLGVIDGQGNTLVLVENRAVHVMPFLAGIANLTGRFFSQGFIQVDVDTLGSQVYTAPVGGGFLANGGRLRDTSRLYADLGFGYWLRKRGESKDAVFNAIIPTFELHYDTTLGDPTAIATANGYTLGRNSGRVSNMTLVFGSTFEVDNTNALSIGYAMPAGNSSDQMFDGALRVLWNRFL